MYPLPQLVGEGCRVMEDSLEAVVPERTLKLGAGKRGGNMGGQAFPKKGKVGQMSQSHHELPCPHTVQTVERLALDQVGTEHGMRVRRPEVLSRLCCSHTVGPCKSPLHAGPQFPP